ncbi:MAG: WD40 repeat domain-containing protein, partial [Actinomycetota bacterium]|nr:WD40 repeat domain-containing protein [Actinomycetota bacterium]
RGALAARARGPHALPALHRAGAHPRRCRSSNEGKGGSVGDSGFDIGSLREASFISEGDRVILSVMPWTQRKRCVYRFSVSDDFVGDGELDAAMADVREETWESGTPLVIRTPDDIVFLDKGGLEARAVVSLRDLGLQTSGIKTALSESGDYYLVGEDQEGTTVMYRVREGDAQPNRIASVGRAVINQVAALEDADGGRRLLVAGYIGGRQRIVVFDPDDPQDESRMMEVTLDDSLVDGASSVSCGCVWPTDDMLIVLARGDTDDTRMLLLDRRTGERVDTELSGYSMQTATRAKREASLSPDGKRFSLVCPDGKVRLFDAAKGFMLWESPDKFDLVNLLAITNEGNVFLQDDTGACFLLSGKTGEVLRSTSVYVPPFQSIYQSDGAEFAQANFSEGGMLGDYGVVLMSLEEESFGPVSVLYGGMFASEDGKLFMYKDPFYSTPHSARLLSLDELLSLARDTVKGHELTDAQRRLYGV